MAIDKITTSGLSIENLEIEGTEAAKMPVGTTAQRANVQAGDIRFNSTLSLMEYYDGTQWKSIDSPPVVSSISPDNFDTAGDTITVTGSNFQSGLTVKIVSSSGTDLSASTVTFTNSSTISFDITQAMVDDDNDPYDVVVTNPSGLSATLSDGLDFAPEPAFTVAAGTLATIYDSARSSLSFTTGATSTESDATITYAVTTGSLPSGLSISSSTGTITGSTSAVGSDTTTTFTITATATDSNSNITTNTRQYSIIQKAPVVTSYTSTGSGTFTVPSGLTSIDVLVVAGGGGGGGASNGGTGGGAGGLIYRPAYPVTPGSSISYTVGAGGQSVGGPAGSSPYPSPAPAQFPNFEAKNGQDSIFDGLTAKGGGAGGSENKPNNTGNPGGSGGGASRTQGGGTGIQPQQPGDSGTYGFGNPGGQNNNDGSPHYSGGGGGGAGAAGQNGGASSPGGIGGNGRQYDISGTQVYYAGGGGGSPYSNGAGASGLLGNGGQGGGGQGGIPAQPGTANRGGGGGGGRGAEISSMNNEGGNGGSGIVIVKY